MSGGSDYYSFSENGIPAGALATGASAIKTVAQRDIFGGFTNAQLDPSYHKFEDDYGNYNVKALADMSFAAASVIDKLITVQNLREYLVKGAI